MAITAAILVGPEWLNYDATRQDFSSYHVPGSFHRFEDGLRAAGCAARRSASNSHVGLPMPPL